MVQSISLITKVFQTSGSNPVKVLCSDVNEYVCKYRRNNPAKRIKIRPILTTKKCSNLTKNKINSLLSESILAT